jgi:hypothetical protein
VPELNYKHHAIKTYGKVEVQFQVILTSTKMDVSGQLQDPVALPLGKGPPVPTGEEAGSAPEMF